MNERAESWWDAVKVIAGLVVREGIEPSDEEYLRHFLQGSGFDGEDIRKARDWIEEASLGGKISEIMGALAPSSDLVRVAHPLEKASISDQLWDLIVKMRQRGMVDQGLIERMLEGLRTVDARDWEGEEVEHFFNEVMASSAPSVNIPVAKFLRGRTESIYS